MALLINIDDLINARTVESVRVEFKTGWNPLSILKTVCAFANDIDEFGGGYIVVGIEEIDGSPILPPKGIEQKDLDKIQREFFKLCQDNLKENIFPPIVPIEFQGKWILVIWVSPGEQRPYHASDGFGKNAQLKIFVRHGAITKEADNEQERRLRDLGAIKHFDDRLNVKASIDDLDLGLILAYLQEIKSQLYDEATKIPLRELLLKMQLARGPKENFRPTNLAMLLFSKEPEKYFSGCITNLIEIENEAETQYSEKQFRGPIHTQIRNIMEYFNSNVIKQFVRKNTSQTKTDHFFNYPYQALRETVVNSMYHRSYENPTPNEIRIYKFGGDRRIEILSYPGPLPPIDEQSLLNLKITARNYRNIKLGDWLKNLHLAEKYATGIPTIVSSLEMNGSPKPFFSTDEVRSHFLTILKIHPDTPFETGSSVDEIERILLSDIQQTILETVIKQPTTETELSALFEGALSENLAFLLVKELLAFRDFPDSRLYFITKRGTEVLKNSF